MSETDNISAIERAKNAFLKAAVRERPDIRLLGNQFSQQPEALAKRLLERSGGGRLRAAFHKVHHNASFARLGV